MLSNPINTTMNIALTGANQVLEECLFLESQRDSATKPRVARNELPWARGAPNNNPNGVATRDARSPKPKPRWGFVFLTRCPRVARSSQPWALGRNPFGIGRLLKSDLHMSISALPLSSCDRGRPRLLADRFALHPRSLRKGRCPD